MADRLAPSFLGAYGENDDFFEKVVTELLRDHGYWRRNVHREDTPPIRPADQYAPDDDDLFLRRHTRMNPWLLSPQAPGAPTAAEASVQHCADLARRELRS